MKRTGQTLLVGGAVLLTLTAALHASGTRMVADWTDAFEAEQSYGLQLVWLTDSLAWLVTALIWLIAAWRPDRSWRAAAMLLASIPLLTGLGILLIDPTFFGGHLLLACGAVGLGGALLMASASKPAGDQHAP